MTEGIKTRLKNRNMKNQEIQNYYRVMDNLIVGVDKKKMEFARHFLKNVMEVEDLPDSQITIAAVHFKSLQYLIFTLILEYEEYKGK
jgi:hypothetical protein